MKEKFGEKNWKGILKWGFILLEIWTEHLPTLLIFLFIRMQLALSRHRNCSWYWCTFFYWEIHPHKAQSWIKIVENVIGPYPPPTPPWALLVSGFSGRGGRKVMVLLIWNSYLGIKHALDNRPLACVFCFPVSDHVMPSWELAFCFFISYAYICTCIRRHLKETIPSNSITWSETGKQNIQAKEVHFLKCLVQDYS